MKLEFCRIALRWVTGCVGLLFTSCLTAGLARDSMGISEEGLTRLANRAMLEYQVPGMAVGIIKSDRVVLSKGFGLRELGKKNRVTPDTLFKIASNSKAFTTAAMAILVDQGQVSWDSLVIDHLPEFRMKDPWVTANFTLTDLLTHRSGLPAFVGDMLLWPEPNSFTREDIIHALRYFEPVSGFRSTYAYDNVLYIVAGEVIARITGVSWGEFVEKRIMRPAGMNRCFADRIPGKEMKNLATPHGVIDGQLSIIERGRISDQPPVSAAAGGIVCSLDDMLTWARTQLRRGVTPSGTRLYNESQSRELWKPRTLRSVSERDFELNRTHFKAYGLGWRLADVHGFKEISHTGTLAGMNSYVVLIPELELGVVLLTNGSSSAARKVVMNSVVRSFMPVEQLDWIQLINDEMEMHQHDEKPAALRVRSVISTSMACCPPELSQFTGRYRDPWFGDVMISMKDDQLVFTAKKSPKLTGVLSYHDGNRFIIRWIDRSLEADAYIHFEKGTDDQIVAASMTKLDPGDFDFEDLTLSKVE